MVYIKISKIKKITKNSRTKVYDLVGIPGNHNFIANNIVVHNCDEAIKFAAGHSHNKSESKMLKELMAVIRPKRFLMFLVIPEMSWLDSKYREAMSSFWLRMIERGVGVMFEKDKGECADHYHLKEIENALGTIKYFTPMDKIKKKLKKISTYFDTFDFPDLPQKVYDEYELYRNMVNLQRQAEEMELSNKDLAKIATWNLMNNWDRLKLEVNKSKENRMTYDILIKEVLTNPVTRVSLASEPTVRNWLKGVNDYVKSKGKEATVFDVSQEYVNK